MSGCHSYRLLRLAVKGMPFISYLCVSVHVCTILNFQKCNHLSPYFHSSSFCLSIPYHLHSSPPSSLHLAESSRSRFLGVIAVEVEEVEEEEEEEEGYQGREGGD